MAKSVVVRLIDDIDGGDADETLTFALDGKSYEIDLNRKNASALRKSLKLYIDKGRHASRSSNSSRSGGSSAQTAFSRLNPEEKHRFRVWANLPDARRIADAKVNEWIGAGKP